MSSSIRRVIVNTQKAPGAIGPYNQVPNLALTHQLLHIRFRHDSEKMSKLCQKAFITLMHFCDLQLTRTTEPENY